DTIPVGKITGVHGVKGEVKLAPYGDLDDVQWKTVYVGTGPGARHMEVKRVRPHKGQLIFELEGLADRDAAAALVGTELSISAEELPALSDDEYYHAELIGARVETDDGRQLGLIEDVITTGGNDVLEVRGEYGEVLVPVVEGVVLGVDRENRKVSVHLLEGLLPEEKSE
ncbi:MAG: ribosome maturation factor RimM, partial [Thermodesulfobacteriota bacterium]